jgi:hypothetical protein
MVVSGQQGPGLQFCLGVAEALGEPPERVLRRAGYLPHRPALDQLIEEIVYCLDRMTPEAQTHFVRIARALADEERVEQEYGTGEPVGYDLRTSEVDNVEGDTK